METNELSVNVTEDELRSILLLIRCRQDDVNHVDESSPNFKKFRRVDVALERLKIKLSNQLV